MKSRTHSGAKKRLKLLPGGKVKRKQTRKRHLMSAKNAKRKHHLSGTAYVDAANINQTRRLLNF
jgi:large subunit ribosomal protein L35